jgi:drug/metabolite transporter (DMT)-like permease
MPAAANSNAYLLLFFTMTFWGGNAVAGRIGAAEASPVTLTMLRWVFACSICFLMAHKQIRADWPALKRNWPVLFALGSIGFAGFNLMYYWALHHTTALNVAIIQAVLPLMIVGLNFIFFAQRLRWVQMLGVLITMFGAAIIVAHGDLGSLLSLAFNQGDLIMLGALALYAIYTVGLRFKPNLHWLSIVFGLSLGALLTVAPFFAAELLWGDPRWPGIDGWLVVAYIAIFPSLIAQSCFIRAVELVGPNRAGAFVNLTPVMGSLLAILILGERLEIYHVVALLLVFAGLAVVERFAHK